MLCDKRTLALSAAATVFMVSGATAFGVGFFVHSPEAIYSGLGGIGAAFLQIVYLLCTLRRHTPTPAFPAPTFPPYVYTVPGMKRNKSDTSLELMSSVGSPKTDDSGRVLTLNLV